MTEDKLLLDETAAIDQEVSAFDQEVLDVIYGPGSGKRGPTRYDIAILGGLQRVANIYQGTVPPAVVAERRRKNKVARASRRINRGNR